MKGWRRVTGTGKTVDLFVIGGGINGCGIARDAAGRGLSVTLAEMGDLAQATSSASTKLFHGGLRYLEYFEFRLVREALIEREVLLRAMPHISWPMRFVLPYHPDMRFESDTPTSKLLGMVMPWMKGRRPAWLIRLGLFMYDTLGGRKILPGTRTLSLDGTPEGAPLQERFHHAYEYSDCWVEDSRLVVLNARDAEARGATVMTGTKVMSADRHPDHWIVTTQDVATGRTTKHRARMLVNAGGPWVGDLIQGTIRLNSTEGVRLVRGSHIVTRRLYDHDKCYFFQGTDGRIIFAIPYETDFTLIGTTDADHQDPSVKPECTPQERDYLLGFANQYFRRQLTADDVVWSYSGVRPLYDDGAQSATAATRDYTLKVDQTGGAPVLNVFGGKITTFRELAERGMHRLTEVFPQMGPDWTETATLPGGEIANADYESFANLQRELHPWMPRALVQHYGRLYGARTKDVVAGAMTLSGLGRHFGGQLYEAEARYLVAKEWARSPEDILTRRTKHYLHLTKDQQAAFAAWFDDTLAPEIA